MRTSETDKLVLQERERIGAYLRKEGAVGSAFAINSGKHLPYPPVEPRNDEHAVRMERAQAIAYLCEYGLRGVAVAIEHGKHVPDGG